MFKIDLPGPIDFSDKRWAYLLGVIHGDGHISNRSIGIAVGHKTPDYAKIIFSIWKDLGYDPKWYTRKNGIEISVHRKGLANYLLQFKSNGIWTLPDNINNGAWISGIFDTDGCVSDPAKLRAIHITLKRSGNLNLVASVLEKLGIHDLIIRNSVVKLRGKIFETERFSIGGYRKVLQFAKVTELKYQKKRERLDNAVKYIKFDKEERPLWRQLAIFLSEPKTTTEIIQKFNLSENTLRYLLKMIRENFTLNSMRVNKSIKQYQIAS